VRRLTISLLLVSLVASVSLGWLFDQLYDQYYIDEQVFTRDKTHAMEQLGLTLAKTLDELPNRQEFVHQWQEFQQSATQYTQKYGLEIIELGESPLPDQLLDGVRQGTPLVLETSNHLSYYFYLVKINKLLVLNASLDSGREVDHSLNYLFTSLFYIVLLSLFFLWAFPLVKQLLALRQAAKSFGRGELKQRVKLSSFSYIRDIELEFNHMAQRIENLLGDVKLLSSAVSHDLRTPLARIRFGVDTLQEEEDPVLRRRFEKKISDNVDDMTSLVETLLAYSRLNQSMLQLDKEHFNLSVLVAACIEKLDSASNTTTFQLPREDVIIHADKSYISILVNNLLQNAVKYGNGKINVELSSEGDVIKLDVDDNGDGVPVEMREKIFMPFIRGNETNDKSSGHGIGLAIVKRIVEWHKGEVEVCNSDKLPGARFSVGFPKHSSPPL